MPSKVPIRDQESLEAMHTGSLLSYLRKLRECEEAFSASDRVGHEPESDPQLTGDIEFKNTKEWESACSLVKKILSGREHIPTAAERKRIRNESR